MAPFNVFSLTASKLECSKGLSALMMMSSWLKFFILLGPIVLSPSMKLPTK